MLLYWIWFAQLKGLSLWKKQRLLEHFPDPEEIYTTDPKAVGKTAGLEEKEWTALEEKDLSASRSILRSCSAEGICILTCLDEGYPERLRNTEDPPVVLYYKGRLPTWNAQPVIAVVGTRKASGYGLQTCHDVSAQIAACGALVISGGADGIDTAAMEGALSAGKATVAVLGCGVDVVYPRKNQDLFRKTRENGCILSEYPPKTKPEPWNFPRRNRIISGISDGVLVVEAPAKSGALNTASHAFHQGRDVYVLPGNLGVSSCAGSNRLLQEGAFAALSGWDIVKQYAPLYPGVVENRPAPAKNSPPSFHKMVAQEPAVPEKTANKRENKAKKFVDKEEISTYSVLNKQHAELTADETAVLALLTDQPETTDVLLARTDLPFGTVQSILTRLTIKGLVKPYPGGRISLK